MQKNKKFVITYKDSLQNTHTTTPQNKNITFDNMISLLKNNCVIVSIQEN